MTISILNKNFTVTKTVETKKENIITVEFIGKFERDKNDSRIFVNFLNVNLNDFGAKGSINNVIILKGARTKKLYPDFIMIDLKGIKSYGELSELL